MMIMISIFCKGNQELELEWRPEQLTNLQSCLNLPRLEEFALLRLAQMLVQRLLLAGDLPYCCFLKWQIRRFKNPYHKQRSNSQGKSDREAIRPIHRCKSPPQRKDCLAHQVERRDFPVAPYTAFHLFRITTLAAIRTCFDHSCSTWCYSSRPCTPGQKTMRNP